MEKDTRQLNANDLLEYVADRMPAEKRLEYEQLFMENDVFAEEVDELEFALLDDYAYGRLQAHQRSLVEQWLERSPRHRQHLAISSGLMQSTRRDTRTGSATRWLGWAALAASIAAISVFTTDAVRHPVPAPARQVAQVSDTSGSTISPGGTSFDGNTILLRAERFRGAETKTRPVFKLDPAKTTRLQVIVGSPIASETFSLTVTADELSHADQLHFENLHSTLLGPIHYIEVKLPSQILPGKYSAHLQSASANDDVTFAVAYN